LANGNKTKKKKPQYTVCPICGERKKMSDFYYSNSHLHAGTGKVPYCKDCIKKMSVDKKGNIDVEKFKEILKEIDKPYLYEIMQSAYREAENIKDGKGDVIGIYFKNINSLPLYRDLTWKDSILNVEIEDDSPTLSLLDMASNFEITDDIVDKWGAGYSNEEYFYFEKKWEKLIDNYGQKTSFHIEGLITYIRFRVKEELATAKGTIGEAKAWGALAKDAAGAAKINVSQLSKSDISGGIELLPQLFEAVESKVGIIPILPKLKAQPYDDADMIIWCNVNYIRRLEGKPAAEYKDIWLFYDEMLEEYYKQQGFTDERIKKEKEKRNNVFRDLGQIYVEPEYENDGDQS